jgi:carbon storage regulator CsrA
MLVLSRKLKEKIVLPTLGVTIQVAQIKRGVVRLGIDAPPDVTVLREEVSDRAKEWGSSESPPEDRTVAHGSRGELPRRLPDWLRTTGTGLGLLRLQLDAGMLEDARATLARIQDDFQLLRFGVEGELDSPVKSVSPPEPKPQRALLVEDDSNQRELLAGFLRQSGMAVDTAGDGADALDYLHSREKPDVILLDMGLPRVDGPTIVRELRRDRTYAGLKIFGVTGHRPEEFNLERGPAGVDRWFQKPLDPTVLLHDLQEELAGSRFGV